MKTPHYRKAQSQTAAQVQALNQRLTGLGQRFVQLSAQGDFVAALAVNEQARRIVPRHPGVLGDAALCHLRLGDWEKALGLYLQACELAPQDENLWDGLTETCGHLGRMAEVRQHGLHSLMLKDQKTRAQAAQPLPTRLPVHNTDAQRQVIAFSLFGDHPRYCETAKLNVSAAQQLLPHWTCRFYVDDTVPVGVRDALRTLGAQVLEVTAADRQTLSGLMWRFLVLEDDSVDRFLIRDADSLISRREVAAIEAWLQSDRFFHLIRDYFSHTELLLAGMWGGCGGVFKNLRQQMVDFVAQGQYLGQRVVDQHFLRMHIWPTVRQSLLSHDPVYGFMQGQDFPPHEVQDMGHEFHVGCNLSSSSIGAESALPDGQQVGWKIVDAQQQTICQYTSTVRQGQWRADIPGPYAKLIGQGVWRVEVLL
jgi:tetratricopeptide (TPR) repeat protein